MAAQQTLLIHDMSLQLEAVQARLPMQIGDINTLPDVKQFDPEGK